MGSVYALVALGFTIIHSVTGVINFAQGDFVMLGGMLAYLFLSSLGLPLWTACLLAIVIVTLIGLLLERLAIHSARRASVVSLIIVTIGASIFIRGLAGHFWGKEPVPLPAFSGEKTIEVAGATIQPQSIWVISMALIFMLLFHLILSRTLMGKALKACAINRSAASIVGINTRNMSLLSFGIAAALGAVGGVVIAPLTLTSYDIGVMLGLKGFVVAAMSGLSSQLGAVICGISLGLLEAFGAAYISSAYKGAIALVVLFIVLLIRAESLSDSEAQA